MSIRASIGDWLNTVWDDTAAVALLALEERTNAAGSPVLRASTIRKLGLDGGKAALIACPRPAVLEIIHRVEQEQGLPSPMLGGQWAKTSAEVRSSWMITGLTAAPEPAAFKAQRVFQTARALGVRHVVISLGWWNRSLGSYELNPQHFPSGMASLRAVADQAHASGLKLGIHVMTRSISNDDALVTPRPDPRLLTEGTVTLSATVDARAREIPTIESPADFGTGSGYWANRGTDLLIDEEIVHYQAITARAPFALTQCVRGAYGTRAAPHTAGAKARHLTERYGWYVASAELAESIGRSLARLIDDAGLDMFCFDGADVTADPNTRFFDAHKVPLGLFRNVHRDVLIVSNGSSHYGWHLMARGGEEDAMARGYQGWVDQCTVHSWGAYHLRNLVRPDFSWVGIFGHTPTMTAARPDDVELVCARSLGYDAAIGWGFAACYGGPSAVDVFERNGRKQELARLIRTFETARLHDLFSPGDRQLLDGPDPNAHFPEKLIGNGEPAWVQLHAVYPAPLNFRCHRAVGLWVKGDGQGEVLNVQLHVSPQSYLHYYLPIDFTGWKYCELGEPEGDRVLDYFVYEKFALHDLPLDRFHAVTLMILRPPPGKQVDLRLGRIEALTELGGELVEPEIRVGERSLHLPVTLQPEQYLEIGDPWGSRDPGVCRVFDADGNELKRINAGPPLNVQPGPVSCRVSARGTPAARARITLLLERL